MIKDKIKNISQEVKNVNLAIKLLNNNIDGITFKKYQGMNSQFEIILTDKKCRIGLIDFTSSKNDYYKGYVLDVYLNGLYIENNVFEYNFATLHDAIINSDDVSLKLIKYIKTNLTVV